MTCSKIIFVAAAFFIPLSLQSQAERYHHPDYDISFEASPNWTEQFPDTNSSIYSFVNPNHNMVISLTYVPDCKKPKKYMKKLSGLKGMVYKRDSYDTVLNDYEALILCGNCLELRESFTIMVVGFPTEKGLYLMEISCPDNCQSAHRNKLHSILSSIRIGKNSAI